jgi:hypothetical protein
MKIWITTYALTDGILTGELLENGARSPNSVTVLMNNPQSHGKRMHVFKPHWWTSEVAAHYRAEQMRKERIKSLEKSLDKIRKLEIKVLDQ